MGQVSGTEQRQIGPTYLESNLLDSYQNFKDTNVLLQKFLL